MSLTRQPFQTRNETTPAKAVLAVCDEEGPFRRALFWPEKREKTTKDKRKSEKVPSVITSNEWKKYCMRKEKEKTEKEQKKEKNRLIREVKKKEKENQGNENKYKPRERRRKARVLRSKTETETEEEDHICDDSSDNIVLTDSDDASLTKVKSENIHNQVEMYYAVHYDVHLPSVGRVISIQNNLCQIKFLKQIMENTYNWPTKDYIQDVDVSFILHGPIKLIGNGSFTIDRNQMLKIRSAK